MCLQKERVCTLVIFVVVRLIFFTGIALTPGEGKNYLNKILYVRHTEKSVNSL